MNSVGMKGAVEVMIPGKGGEISDEIRIMLTWVVGEKGIMIEVAVGETLISKS
jgi:hypothetical protein